MDDTPGWADRALATANPSVLWTDRPDRPASTEPWHGEGRADLVVVGGGYTGLWAALQAKEQDPSLDVVLLESGRLADQASGRNGGFLSASLTHGLDNGIARFPAEIDRLVAEGRRNLDGIVDSLARHDIDAGLELTGALWVADAPWQLDGLAEWVEQHRAHGEQAELLDAAATRAEVASPTYLGAAWVRSGEGLVDPARLGWGLASACTALGVRIHEHSEVVALERHGAAMEVRTDRGRLSAGAVLLGTGAFRSPVRAINRRVVPVYDHVLATEPLSTEQLRSIGWSRRQGVSDCANQFHYYRLTDDDRIVWGGYDAVFHNWGRIHPSLEQRDATHRKLAAHFFHTFPRLEGLHFTHRWGGVIDTSTRFSVGFGTAFDGRVAYAVGYTGLGVAATRFGARVCLDLLLQPESELLRLDLVRKGLLPFPPEPVRTAGIQYTRRAIARADAQQGRRGRWLRLLDRLGLGFDS
jgi:glycine/D-amino acid oxidase-like deaminating enzyme